MEGLIRRLHALRAWVFVAVLVLAGLGAWAASSIRMGQDVTQLLPSLEEEDRIALDILGRSSLFDRLYVEISGGDPGALVDVAERLSDLLLSDPRVEAVESRVTAEEESSTARLLFTHRFALMDPATEGLDEALDPAGVRRRLELDRARMLSPIPGAGAQVASDPLGLVDLVRARMQTSLESPRFRMHEGFAFTPGLDRCLLVLRTRVKALAVDDAGVLVDDVRAAAASAVESSGHDRVVAQVTGAHVIASESARAVKGDVTLAFIVAGIGILLIFGFTFRRPILVLVGLLPSGAGVLAGFAVASLVLDRISGIAVGFGSIVVGISVDYSIHLLSERLVRIEGDDQEALRAGRTVAAVFPSLITGFATTAVVFAFYGFSSFPLIRELGLFAGTGVTVGFITSLFVLPLVPLKGRGARRGSGMPGWLLRPSSTVSAILASAILGLTVAMGAFVPGLHMQDDIRKLDYRSEQTAAFAEQFEDRWLGPQQGLVAIARGEDLDAALRLSDGVSEVLRDAGVPFTSPSSILPSLEKQRSNLSALGARDWVVLRGTIEREASALGFVEGAFDPFFEDLGTALAGGVEPLRLDDLEGTPLAHLAAGTVVEGPGQVAVLTFLPGAEQPSRILDLLGGLGPEVSVTSRVVIMNHVFEAVRSEVLHLIMLSLLGILLVLVLRYRRIAPSLMALLPVLVACVVTAGSFALARMQVNAIAVLAFTLIVGVGLDYGIFVVDALERGPAADHTAQAVFVSGLTTLMSFGVLTACRNPVLRSTGLVVLVGVAASLVAALALLPALHSLAWRWRRRS